MAATKRKKRTPFTGTGYSAITGVERSKLEVNFHHIASEAIDFEELIKEVKSVQRAQANRNRGFFQVLSDFRRAHHVKAALAHKNEEIEKSAYNAFNTVLKTHTGLDITDLTKHKAGEWPPPDVVHEIIARLKSTHPADGKLVQQCFIAHRRLTSRLTKDEKFEQKGNRIGKTYDLFSKGTTAWMTAPEKSLKGEELNHKQDFGIYLNHYVSVTHDNFSSARGTDLKAKEKREVNNLLAYSKSYNLDRDFARLQAGNPHAAGDIAQELSSVTQKVLQKVIDSGDNKKLQTALTADIAAHTQLPASLLADYVKKIKNPNDQALVRQLIVCSEGAQLAAGTMKVTRDSSLIDKLNDRIEASILNLDKVRAEYGTIAPRGEGVKRAVQHLSKWSHMAVGRAPLPYHHAK